MKKYFTIGEISKLFNIPIKTLRYYNEIGLLTPAYTNPDNNYRYYSVEQFIIIIDIIRNSKMMGLSLEEIRHNINARYSISDNIQILDKQIDSFENNFKRLMRIKESMESRRKTYKQIASISMNQVYISYEKERKYLSYDYVSENIDEQEINFRKVILEAGCLQDEVYSIFGTGARYDTYVKEGKIINPDIRYYVDNEELRRCNVLPEGNYVTVVFDDNAYNKYKYYEMILSYVKSNNIEVVGDFNETWIIPRIGEDGQETTVVKLDLMCK